MRRTGEIKKNIASNILNLGNRRRRLVSLTLRSHYLRADSPHLPLVGRSGRPHSQSGGFGEIAAAAAATAAAVVVVAAAAAAAVVAAAAAAAAVVVIVTMKQ